VALCGAAPVVIGCAPKPTAPPASVSTPRAVGVALMDSTGVGLARVTVFASSLFSVNGAFTLTFATTDAAGEAVLQLHPGPWIISAGAADGRVAGSHALIPAASGSDSVLVRLVARAPSRIEGHARLAGRADHRGIIVTSRGLGGLAITDSSGAYSMGGFPPGTWSLLFDSLGFGDAFTFVTVPAPASTVTAPDVELISSPAPW
jgi:hypothetical protein